MKWYISALRKYSEFNGRSRRSEFWMFLLINTGIIFLLSLPEYRDLYRYGEKDLFTLSTLYRLAVFIPTISVIVRRLHDLNKSGSYFFMFFIPVIGQIYLIVLMATEGDAEDNPYGPNPKKHLNFQNEIG